MGAEFEVFEDADVFGEWVIFGHVADEGFGLLGVCGEGDIIDEGGAGSGLLKACEDAEGGGFAGAIGAEEADDFALWDGEREVVDGFVATVSFGEIGDLNAVVKFRQNV